jgi:CheY-like chemotaxis protein/anti-sigma regulatory factor (Ser/Thr protein kinase)
MTDISAIQRNSKHLLNLVNDVLDLSQVESLRMALSRDWIEINDLVRDAAAIVESLFQSKGLYLNLKIDQNLPQIYCDRTRIRQVIINILSNAGRFTRTGGVTIETRAVNDQLLVSITDTGPGIPPEDQKRIFEPFQQLDNSTRRQYGGSGLGLTISKQFIEMHEGQMSLESHPGNGTTFFFTLPLTPSLNELKTVHRPTAKRSLIPGDEYGFTLRTRPSKAPVPRLVPRLVVYEKEQSLQRMLNRYLTDTEVIAASTLPDVTDAINRSPAQAVVVNVPPHETVPAEILAIAPFGTPVISCWLPGEVEAANQLGVIQYLMKPITREKLLSVLEALPRQLNLPGEMKYILVVDDEPDELHLFARMLESALLDYRVIQVSNGKRALDILRSRKIDIVLLDLIMPVMNGFQVLEEKRKDPAISDIPVIVISSRDPLGEAITSNTIQISHNGGFSTSHLLEVIQAITEIIMPENENSPKPADVSA